MALIASSSYTHKVCLETNNLVLPCSTCSITLKAFLAAHPPMETWSSVAALVERESTEEGWHKALFSETAKIQRNECRTEWARDSKSNGQPGAKSPSTTSGSTIAPLSKMHQCFYLD